MPTSSRLRRIILAHCACLAVTSLRAGTLQVGDAAGAPNTTVNLPVQFAAFNTVVGAQFDLVYNSNQTATGDAAFTELAGANRTDLLITSRALNSNTRRIVVYSKNQQTLPSGLALSVPMALTALAPNGGPTVQVSNVVLATASGSRIYGALQYTPITAWRLANFLPAELANPNVVGDDRDPNGDGVPNLVAFALGISPKQAEPSKLPETNLAVDPQDGHVYFNYTFRQSRNALSVVLNAQASMDLKSWTYAPVPVPTGNQDTNLVEFFTRVDATGQPRLFMRLTARRSP